MAVAFILGLYVSASTHSGIGWVQNVPKRQKSRGLGTEMALYVSVRTHSGTGWA